MILDLKLENSAIRTLLVSIEGLAFFLLILNVKG